MKTFKIDPSTFQSTFFSVVQILSKLADPTFIFNECGRGTGKTTHIMAPRLDRVQDAMPGAINVLGASTYKSIFDNILPGIMEYFIEHYERGIYFEIGKQPPKHFKKCSTYIADWKHTVSFHTGSVLQFVSCDRPESMLGKNAAHLHADELLKIPKDKFLERIIPALRSDRSKFGHSHYFMGISGYSSTPNFETDYDWWLDYEKNMNRELMDIIMEIALELDRRLYEYEIAKKAFDEKLANKLERYIKRWSERLTELRRGQTFYLRASSLSNIKILGVDYIENQDKSIKDEVKFNTSILSVRKHKVKDKFFGKFDKQHIFDDSYTYNLIDTYSADAKPEFTGRDLKYCDSNQPLIAGFDPGPFMSIVFAQRKHVAGGKEFRAIKNMWVIHPAQHEELAVKINDFFKYHRRKEIYLYYDRAANQKNPYYRKYYPINRDDKESDAIIFKQELEKLGWRVHLLSLGQATITHGMHYRLLNKLFGKHPRNIDDILVCRNECEELISSINHSPLKRADGVIELDKSSEKLPFEDQILYSTQIASAFMYMLYGEFKKLIPEGDGQMVPSVAGTYSI